MVMSWTLNGLHSVYAKWAVETSFSGLYEELLKGYLKKLLKGPKWAAQATIVGFVLGIFSTLPATN